MYGLHTILRIVGVGHIRDTQCGFKLFSRAAAQQIFPAQHLPTWIFDVELLLLAKQLRVPVAEVPIEWHEVAGSKLNVVTASLQMLRDLLIVRANHLLGRWTAGPVGRSKTEYRCGWCFVYGPFFAGLINLYLMCVGSKIIRKRLQCIWRFLSGRC